MYVVEKAQTNKLIRNLWQAYSCKSYDRSWCIDLMTRELMSDNRKELFS